MLRVVAGILFLLASVFAHAPVIPAGASKPVGPYSPGIDAGDMLYVSGQGARAADGSLADGIAAQTRQALRNVKAVLEAGGVTPQHVVAVQFYLDDVKNLPEADKVYREFFPKDAPARVVVGVSRMPTGTPVEINAVAVKDLSKKRVTPAGVWAGDRLYLNAIVAPTLVAAQRQLEIAIRQAGLPRRSLVSQLTFNTGKTFFADVPVAGLPGGAKAALFAVAARDAGELLRTGCRSTGNTLYCETRSAEAAGTIEAQTRGLFAKLQERVEAHGFHLADIVASNVWLNDLDQFQAMNAVYATYFPAAPPTRTTVQPAAKSATAPGIRISIVAVR